MRVLHTSDWHLGHALYGRKRDDEFVRFFDWLLSVLKEKEIDLMLVSGDVFDTGTPSNAAQEIYYQFLSRVANETACERIVLTGGNHDSPSFLNAPQSLLKSLHIEMVGAATDDPADEVLYLKGRKKDWQAVVCAVPFLRDKDVRKAFAGESQADKDERYQAGVAAHYAAVRAKAQAILSEKEISEVTPVIAMGHLFIAGSMTKERLKGQSDPLYVGSLGRVPIESVALDFDYVALGHLHMAQKVGDCDHVRYSGSIVPVSVYETARAKEVVIVDFEAKALKNIETLEIPVFQPMVQIIGDWETIEATIDQLKITGSHTWIEVEYTGQALMSDLRARIEKLVQDTPLEVLRIKDARVFEQIFKRSASLQTLENLSEEDVFNRCLEVNKIADADCEELRLKYREILMQLRTGNAE